MRRLEQDLTLARALCIVIQDGTNIDKRVNSGALTGFEPLIFELLHIAILRVTMCTFLLEILGF